ncbi:MAG: MgtC/SapB family protein [Betaproteobacteria bacterium]|nr:MAG: MgtC/SapB family protein [Betaproteobacteria bacterium]
MSVEDYEILARLMAALVAGAFIGYERSYHGRPAGFRTHALACTASSLLMLVTVYESHWMSAVAGRVQIDPTRMAQGIMTGIGFLGAGVIIKEGFSVRGLTTAASIWITAAIGILAGIGFYFPLVVSVVMTLGVLSLFRWIEARMPSQAYYHFDVRFARSVPMTERQVRELVESHGFSIANFTYRIEGEGRIRRHSMVIRSADRSGAGRLSVALEGMEAVLEFRIAPTGD